MSWIWSFYFICLFFSLAAAKLICARTGHQFFKNIDFLGLHPLKMCKRCTSLKHNASSCPGKDDKLPFDCVQCKSHSHITALCPNLSSESVSSNFCVNVHQSPSHDESHLLPVLTLTFYGIGKRSRRVQCLLDSGSQRSYLSKDILEHLKGDFGFSSTKYEINTFLGSAE